MRNKLIYSFWKRGKKQADIARMFRLSRQRVWQIVQREIKKHAVEDPLTLN